MMRILDPHIRKDRRSLLYAEHMRCPTSSVSGVCMKGMPKSKFLKVKCSKCKNEYQREQYRNTVGLRRAQHRERYKKNRAQILRDWRIRKYGITRERLDEMILAQQGRCAICDQTSSGRALDIDHCHDSGVVRGLLCTACNLGLSKFADDPMRLRRAADYLDSATA